MEHLNKLLDVWEKLGERERKITLTFMNRLWAGQRKYGPLTAFKKDWTYEAIEEALDASVYLSCALQDRCDKAFEVSVAMEEAEVADTEAMPEHLEWWPKHETDQAQSVASNSHSGAV